MPDRTVRNCGRKTQPHSPHRWEGGRRRRPGMVGGGIRRFLCLGDYPDLRRATAAEHGRLVADGTEFLFFGTNPDPDRRGVRAVLARSGANYYVRHAKTTDVLAMFAWTKRFWAAPTAQEER